MTIEEKRRAIEEYCDDTDCIHCPLDPIHYEVGCWSPLVSRDEIEKYYSVLFEKDTVKEPVENDPIKPNYYNDSKITPFDVIDDWNLGFYLGSAIKYIKRAGKKKDNSRLQDLKKIREYIDQEIAREEVKHETYY